MSPLSRFAVALAVLLLLGCPAPVRVGAFGDHAFYAVRDHYRVLYEERPHVVNADWQLENFRVAGGEVGAAKWTTDHTRFVGIDDDDDGVSDRTLEIESVDLRLSHRTDGSVIWSQTTPLDTRRARRSLQVIARDFVDRVGGGSYIDIDWEEATVRERRFATQVRAEGPITVDGVAGYLVTFDLVSLDQRELDATHEGERITVAVVRPRQLWRADPREANGELPMLVVFGLASRAELHERGRADFDDFLGRVDFR